MHEFFKKQPKVGVTNFQKHLKRNFGKDYKGVSYKNLQILGKQQQSIKNKLFIVKVVLAVLVGIVVKISFSKHDFSLPLYAGTLALNAYILLRNYITKDIKSKFKDEVVIKVIEDIDKNLYFSKDEFMDKEEFALTGIYDTFNHNVSHYSGNDLILGERDGVKFKMCDIHLQEIRGSGKSSRTVNIFHGLVFTAEFNKFFTSHTFIISSAYANYQGERIQTDNSQFNKKFNVYTNDRINAFYILSPSFMERFLRISKRFKCDINAVFFLNKIYIYIDNNKDNFELELDMDLTQITKIFEDIKFEFESFFGIIDDLKLNSKIFKTYRN